MKIDIPLSSGKTLVGEAGEEHAISARALLSRLAGQAAGLAPGESIDVEIDWSLVRLLADETNVTASEPDYHGDPKRFTPSLAFTCGILDAQRKLLQGLQLAGNPPDANSYTRIADTALHAVSAVGVRRAEPDRIFTGWQIVSTERGPDDQFGQYRPIEFAARHPAWLAAMSLPPGWAFRCVGRTVLDCVSPDDVTHAVMISVDV
ncbi:immunity protein Imm33 domain-containing protein [Bradyrhizobium niftali]|uniref:Imm33-like domain-containing protein n=1 Tax=Bradyrhizobium niftali TaxID=2560055 RepID=A0A4Y9M397_9BRAD|nr:hypothetical protein [Bradyrhizobium niftali]TFV49620.1 hypothetical protein E4K65_05310 [Bradyrhizobium niftali]